MKIATVSLSVFMNLSFLSSIKTITNMLRPFYISIYDNDSSKRPSMMLTLRRHPGTPEIKPYPLSPWCGNTITYVQSDIVSGYGD